MAERQSAAYKASYLKKVRQTTKTRNTRLFFQPQATDQEAALEQNIK